MSVNMFGLRLTIEAQPRWKKGHPPHSTTGAVNASCIRLSQRGGKEIFMDSGMAISDIARSRSGAVRLRLIQNRWLISASSGLTSSTAAGVLGSRAMPQMGQEPGASRTTSGCIGQTYSVREGGAGAAITGSSAMPQLGQSPAVFRRTSGCIGQVKAPVDSTGSGSAEEARRVG